MYSICIDRKYEPIPFFQESNKARATLRLVSFRGLIQMFKRESQPFRIGVPSAFEMSNKR